MSQALDTLKELLKVYGPSGREGQVAETIEDMLCPYADEIYTDTLGNLVAVKRGGGKRLMIAAHMDQIGLIITHIDDKGFLRFATVGGISVHNLVGRAVRFENGERGVIGQEEKDVSVEKLLINQLFIDIGESSRQQAAQRVSIGDMAVLDSPIVENGKRISSGALDNRVGCAVLIEAFKRLGQSPYDTYAVFTTQEEVGNRGAHSSAYALEPEVALALDVTIASDTPGAKPLCNAVLGAGPAIKVKDSTLIAHPMVRRWLEDAAGVIKLSCQHEVLSGGGTDGGEILVTRAGVPSGALSVPVRYVHTASETMDIQDFEDTIALLLIALHRPMQ